MTYKEKLIEFNDRPKYESESFFMRRLIDAKPDEKILDFGCGLGRMVWQHRLDGVDCFGFDVMNYRENDNQMIFRSQYHFRFRQIYFMHSIAHIDSINNLFDTAFDDLLESGGRVVIFTPNRDWLYSLPDDPNYIHDSTVHHHFNIAELEHIFTKRGFRVEQTGQFGDVNKHGQCERIFFTAIKP